MRALKFKTRNYQIEISLQLQIYTFLYIFQNFFLEIIHKTDRKNNKKDEEFMLIVQLQYHYHQ